MKKRLLQVFVLATLFVCLAALFDKRPSSRRGAVEAEHGYGSGSDQARSYSDPDSQISASGPSADEEAGAAHLVRVPILKPGERLVPDAFRQRTRSRKPAKAITGVPTHVNARISSGGRRSRMRVGRNTLAGPIRQSTESQPPHVRARSAATLGQSQGLGGRITPGDGQDLSAPATLPDDTPSPASEVRPEVTPAPAKAPAGETGSDAGSLSAPSPSPTTIVERRLTPPVPVEQPPLHPVLRTTIASEALGMAGLQEQTVRGRLRIRLLIRADGVVVRVELLLPSGDLALDNAAKEGLLRWRFDPARENGNPVDAYLLLWVTFRD